VNVVVTTQLELKRTSFEVLSRLAVDNQLYLFGTKLLILVGCGAMALCQHVQLYFQQIVLFSGCRQVTRYLNQNHSNFRNQLKDELQNSLNHVKIRIFQIEEIRFKQNKM